MPDITSATAIRFSNERVRVSADRLAQAYYLADALKDQWDALGGGQTALNALAAKVRQVANKLTELYEWCWRTEKVWFAIGSSTLIPNTADAVVDGSPGDGRSANTGAKCNNVMSRVIEFQNWLLSSTGSFSDTARNSIDWYNTVLKAHDSWLTLDTTIAGDLVTRCGELRTNYEASSSANLNTLLALAVNPTSGV